MVLPDRFRPVSGGRAGECLPRKSGAKEAAAKVSNPSPTPPSKADVLSDIAGALSDIATIHITTLEAAANVNDDNLPPPDANIEEQESADQLRDAVAALPDKERQLMEAYYFEGKKLEEAGAELGLSKSWASRVHARAIQRLNKRLTIEMRA